MKISKGAQEILKTKLLIENWEQKVNNTNEAFGWSKKEKEAKKLEQFKNEIVAELNNFEFTDLLRTGENGNTYPEIWQSPLNQAESKLPKTLQAFPELFNKQQDSIKVRYDNHDYYYPFNWQWVIINGELDPNNKKQIIDIFKRKFFN